MGTKANMEQLGQLSTMWNELFRLTQQGVRPADAVKQHLQQAIEGKFSQPEEAADLFAPGEQQIRNVRHWNATFGWGFTEADFERANAQLATITRPTGRLTALVLVPYLDTVERTFEELWAVAAMQQPNQWRWDDLKSDKQHLRLLEGITHQPGLRWEIIQLDAHWDKTNGIRPMDVRGSMSAHAGILAAAAHFPKWVQAMGGETVPFVWMAGYECSLPGVDAWRDVPYLLWGRSYRQVQLRASWNDGYNCCWAVPVRREC